MEVSLIHPMMKVTNPDRSDLVLLMGLGKLLILVIRIRHLLLLLLLLLVMRLVMIVSRHVVLWIHHHLLLHHNHGRGWVLHSHPLLLLSPLQLLRLRWLRLRLLLLLLLPIQIATTVGRSLLCHGFSSEFCFCVLGPLPLPLNLWGCFVLGGLFRERERERERG